jgi:cleavage and polyadenylation specificity factor subunit 1
MLEARHFVIITDHMPITYAFQQNKDKCSSRQFKHLDFISQFTRDIRHNSGQDNVYADALSRVESIATPAAYETLAAAQESDDELHILLETTNARRLEKIQIPGTTVSIDCDTSTRRTRPYVPTPLRFQVCQSVRDLSHPGTKAAAKIVAERFVWPGVQMDCRIWTRFCQSCQRSKVSRHSFGDFTLPAARFLHIHIDLMGSLPTSAGYTYCLTAVDRFTRWPEVVPIPDITADTVGHALLTGWISHFGCPQTFTTDQGRQFEFQLFHSLAKLCGIQFSRPTAHTPLTDSWNASTGH